MLHPVFLTPGPVNFSMRVQQTLQHSDLSPLLEIYQTTRRRVCESLLAQYQLSVAQWGAVLLPGQSLHAVEAMLLACEPDAPIGVVVQGHLGARMQRLLQQQQRNYRVLELPSRSLSADQLRQWRGQHPQLRYLALAHVEPLYGVMHELAPLTAVCEALELALLLDASCSFGAEDIRVADAPVVAIASGVDAAVQSLSGLAFVVARQSFLTQARQYQSGAAQALSASLSFWHQSSDAFIDLPGPALHALDVALQELSEQGGWRARRRRYQRMQSGVERVLKRYAVLNADQNPAQQLAAGIRCYQLPAAIGAAQFRKQLRQQGFIVSDTSEIGDDRLSIATMGDLDELQISRLHHALEDILYPLSVDIRH